MTTDIFQKRQSVRDYLDKNVETQKIEEIIKAASFAPSACNKQPWRFIVVREKELVKKIFDKGLGGIISNSWAKSAPVFIVACAEKNILVHDICGFIKKTDYTSLDMGAAIENMLLKAVDLGLSTCWIGWFNESNIRKILNIPKHIKVTSLITLGYPKNEEIKEKKRLEINKILYYNKY